MAAITRREVLAAGVATAGAAASGSRALAAPALAAPKRPNVLFVAIDDMNDWTGWLGAYPGVKTPNLDRLARKSAAFRRAYTPSPACQSARAAILFGIEPFRTGVYTNKTGNWTDSILRDRSSIVRWFRQAGYRTYGVGKIFHGSEWRGIADGGSNDPGAWTHFEATPEREGGNDITRFGAAGETSAQMEDVRRAEWLDDNVLSKRHDKPFFAALGVRKPHMPWIVPQRYFDEYPMSRVRYPVGALDTRSTRVGEDRDDRDLPRAGIEMVRQEVDDHRRLLASGEWRSAVRAYLAAITFADHAIGVALNALARGPNASNTIVCVWSDHGWQLGEKLAWRKFTLWERACRVPLLIGGPDFEARKTNALISTIDLFPTLADAAIGERPKDLDGVSFNRRLRGGEKEPRDHVLSTWTLDVGSDEKVDGRAPDKHFAVRTDTHRLIAYGNGDRELYDHRSDPWEWRNLLDKPDKDARTVANQLAVHLPKRAVPRVTGDGSAD